MYKIDILNEHFRGEGKLSFGGGEEFQGSHLLNETLINVLNELMSST